MCMLVVKIVILALAVSAASMTITKASICKSFREWIGDISDFLGELFSCPYCTSHWLAIIGASIFQPLVTDTWIVFDILLVAFAVVTLASYFSGFIFTSIKKIKSIEH